MHVLVNNAGIVLPGSIESQTYAQYRAQLAVSADGTFLGCKYAIPLMAASGGGSIINMASVVSKLAYTGVVSYAAAKGAIEGMSRSIAAHCLESGYRIRCNSIHPGIIDTPMVQNFGPPAGEAESDVPQPPEGARPCRGGRAGHSAEHRRSGGVPGVGRIRLHKPPQEFVIDGGMSMLPAPLTHRLQ